MTPTQRFGLATMLTMILATLFAMNENALGPIETTIFIIGFMSGETLFILSDKRQYKE